MVLMVLSGAGEVKGAAHSLPSQHLFAHSRLGHQGLEAEGLFSDAQSAAQGGHELCCRVLASLR